MGSGWITDPCSVIFRSTASCMFSFFRFIDVWRWHLEGKCCALWLSSSAGWTWHWSLRTNQWRRKSPWSWLMTQLPPEPPLWHPRSWAPNLLALVTHYWRFLQSAQVSLWDCTELQRRCWPWQRMEMMCGCVCTETFSCKMRPLAGIPIGSGHLWD